jgi:hypothetical protein
VVARAAAWRQLTSQGGAPMIAQSRPTDPDLITGRRLAMKTLSAHLTALLVSGAVVLASAEGWAQEKKKYSFVTPPGIAKYSKTHTIEVGDVPNHVLRIFELHTVYADKAPEYDGVKVKEAFTRAFSDYIDGSGTATGYGVSILENGDKIYSRVVIHSHTAAGADGVRKLGYRAVSTLIGGTGRFSGIRGTLLGGGGSDLKTGTMDAWTEGEYWFEK